MVKSQLPDGFATIRTRGLTRSKSRAEQYAPAPGQLSGRRSTMIGVVPPVMKPSESGPLFECPAGEQNHENGQELQQGQQQKQLRYKSSSATAIAMPPPVPPRTSSERTVSDDRSSSVETPEDDDVEVEVGDGEVEDGQQPPSGEQQQQPPTGPYREDDDIYYTSSLTYETFKPLTRSAANLELKVGDTTSNYLNLAQSSEYIESLAYDFSLPPLKSPQYINELNMMRTRALDVSGKGGEQVAPMPLYFAAPPPYTNGMRPDSPQSYGKIRSSYRSTTPESLDNGSSNSSTYSHPVHHGSNGSSRSAFLYDVPAKTIVAVPPLHSLQYRKSFNHSNSRTDIIYEEPKMLHRNGGGISSDTDSSYDGASSGGNGVACYLKIHKNASAELLNFADISTNMLGSRPNGYIRRYATLGHPGKDLRYGPGGAGSDNGGMCGEEDEFGAGAKSTSSLNDQDLVVKVDDDLLNYKVGCQTTLRSKPVIPWYELAIRKDHRQSCPAMKEVSSGAGVNPVRACLSSQFLPPRESFLTRSWQNCWLDIGGLR